MKSSKKLMIPLFCVLIFLNVAIPAQQDPPRADCCWQIWAAGCNLGWATSLMYYTQVRQAWMSGPDDAIVQFINTAGDHILTSNQVCSRLNPAWPGAAAMRNNLRTWATNFRRWPHSRHRQQLAASLRSTYGSFSSPLMTIVFQYQRQFYQTCAEKYFKMGWLLSYAQQTLKIANEQLRNGYSGWGVTVADARQHLSYFIGVLNEYFQLRPITGRCVRIDDFDPINRMNRLLQVGVNPVNLGYMINEVDNLHAQLQQRLPQDCVPGAQGDQNQGDTGLSDVTVNHYMITVSVWDHGSIDGDRVDLYLNGRVVRQNILLQRAKTTFQLQINRGANTLEIRALNEGSSSPNTASMEISHVVQGRQNQKWNLKTGQTGRLRITLQ